MNNLIKRIILAFAIFASSVLFGFFIIPTYPFVVAGLIISAWVLAVLIIATCSYWKP